MWESTQNWVNDVRDFTDLTNRRFADQTDALMTKGGQYISFVHIPTGTEVKFKAFLTQFSDTFSPSWQATEGYGRMDDIQTYKGTKRKIQIGFDVPAASIAEAKDNLKKISVFSQMMYPVFDTTGMGAQTIKSAPFIKMKFMNWVQNSEGDGGLLGILSGFSFAPKLDAGVFQTENNLKTGRFTIYPKAFSISTTLTVIHENRLGWEKTIVEGSYRGHQTQQAGSAVTTKFSKKEQQLFKPQSAHFPYGEKTPTPTPPAASREQIKDGKLNTELLASNQNKISESGKYLQGAAVGQKTTFNANPPEEG